MPDICTKALTVKTVSSLEKILPTPNTDAPSFADGSCLIGERFSYQIAYIGDSDFHCAGRMKININSDISDRITIYNVECVPVVMAAYQDEYDNGYITRDNAIIPDILAKNDGTIAASATHWRSIWIAVETDDAAPGKHNIEISFSDDDDNVCAKSMFELNIISARLPKQTLMFTQWFHCDCISSYYGLTPLSQEHWEYIEKFVSMAADNGINMLLTPIFTPALDTKVGFERPTVQLIDIDYDGAKYTFGFDKLGRWLDMCRKYGIEYLEIAHLYSQWGAEHTPKIVVRENGAEVKKFGWHTDASSDEYKDFLAQMLTALTGYLKENWDCDKVYFHISDEPHKDHIEYYGELYHFVKPYLTDFKLMDALSDYEIYEKGYVDTPVSATRTIDDFIEHDVDNVWAYYCCGEGKYNLSNRFIAMPSYRNRIMGIQLYKYNIDGFLQWGYNFYYTQLSTKLINPYVCNDAEGGFPGGDAFSVYPGADGPEPSLRLLVFYEGLCDMRALKYLESLVGADKVKALVDEYGEITFREYPRNAEYILNLRREVNAMIEENIK